MAKKQYRFFRQAVFSLAVMTVIACNQNESPQTPVTAESGKIDERLTGEWHHLISGAYDDASSSYSSYDYRVLTFSGKQMNYNRTYSEYGVEKKREVEAYEIRLVEDKYEYRGRIAEGVEEGSLADDPAYQWKKMQLSFVTDNKIKFSLEASGAVVEYTRQDPPVK